MRYEQRVRLQTKPPGRDLDGDIFADDRHAHKWLSQKFVSEDRYQVAIIRARKRPGCGKLYGVKTLRTMGVNEFLSNGSTASSAV